MTSTSRPVIAYEPPDLAGEDEGVAGLQHLEIALLHLADLAPGRGALPAGDAHDEHGRRDDGADVQPVAQGGLGVAHPPAGRPGPFTMRRKRS